MLGGRHPEAGLIAISPTLSGKLQEVGSDLQHQPVWSGGFTGLAISPVSSRTGHLAGSAWFSPGLDICLALVSPSGKGIVWASVISPSWLDKK